MLLPTECFEQLKCSLCKRFLSIFPIYILKNDQQSAVCGRCQLPNKENYLRCEIYENLAKNILFPCINKEQGCMGNFLPDDVEQHERICSYQLQPCIFHEQTKCDWNGCFNELLEHYKTQHNDSYLKNNQFEFNITENHDISNILQYDDEIFNFKLNFDQLSKQLKCSIIPVGYRKRTKTYYGQIDLTIDDNTTLSKKFPKIDFIENDTKSIDLNIANMLNEHDLVVKGTIIIVDDEEKFNYFTKQNQKLLKLMECFKCGQIGLNIYNCDNGHYACYKCKDNCCSTTIFDKSARTILEFIYNRCRYGCNFIGNRSDMKLHWFSCLYKPISCLSEEETKCKLKMCRKNIAKHIFNKHSNKIIKLNDTVPLWIDTELSKSIKQHKFINAFNCLFGLIVSCNSENLSFNVSVLHSTEECSNFNIEIHLFDEDNTQEIIMRQSFETSTANKSSISLSLDQFEDLISENILLFKINISK